MSDPEIALKHMLWALTQSLVPGYSVFLRDAEECLMDYLRWLEEDYPMQKQQEAKRALYGMLCEIVEYLSGDGDALDEAISWHESYFNHLEHFSLPPNRFKAVHRPRARSRRRKP